MSYDATVAAALGIYEMEIKKVDWWIEPPPDATPEQIQRTEIISQMMNDMEHSWRDFIGEVVSYLKYGYAINEKVFRRRKHENGSKYNDGYVGWKKLPIRSQDTLDEWVFSEDGRTLLGVRQNLALIENSNLRYRNLADTKDGKIFIPKQKFLHFRASAQRDNPEGTSILRNCYFAWKFRQAIEEQEAVGIAR